MKKILIAIIISVSLATSVQGQSITLGDSLFLNKGTHINNTLADWDSVVVKVMRNLVLVQSIKLTKYATGEYGGVFRPTYAGDYTAVYYAWYGTNEVREEQYFAVLDPADYMGTAAGLTAKEIADSLAKRGWFPGIGAFACTVYTKLSTDNSAIPGVHVIAKNTSETTQLDQGWTNANGWTVLKLDSIAGNAYHKFWLINLDYDFSFPESADVNGNTKITFYGSTFDYGAPPPDSQVVIVDQIFNAFLDSLAGVKVMAKVMVPEGGILRYHGHPITPFEVGDTTKIDGRIRLDLIPTDHLQPTGVKYIFTFTYPLKDGKYFIKADTVTVPYSATPVSYGDLKGW